MIAKIALAIALIALAVALLSLWGGRVMRREWDGAMERIDRMWIDGGHNQE